MRVAVITGVGEVEIREDAQPTPGPGDIAIEVGACGICTMERRLFSGTQQIYPVAPGHEVAGRVVAVGSEVDDLPGSPRIGDAVTVDLLTRCGTCSACRRGRSALCKRPQGGALSDGTLAFGAGLAEFVVAPATSAFATGDAPMNQASMGEPLACVVHSVRLSGFRSGDRVAVFGGGYMGRLHLALTRHLGSPAVGVIDVSAQRLDEATEAGADWVATPDDLADRAGGSDIVFVTAGVAGAVEAALDLCDDGGTVVLYGAFPKDVLASVGADRIHHHELNLIGVYSQEPEDWRTAAGLIASGSLAADLDRLVTARYDLASVGDALRHATTEPVYRVLVGDAEQ
ncbi:MAG: alcohol dehydrogenase catalytic domain-containing protein [Acidimicrobiales bacterium]